MADLHCYLTFDGTCAEAMRFYERVLEGKLEMLMKHGDAPGAEQTPEGGHDRILHARLAFGDYVLMASDTLVGQPYEGIKGISLALVYPTVAEAERVFNAFSDGGNVLMPFGETFWVEAFGIVVDRYGVSWMLNGGAPRI